MSKTAEHTPANLDEVYTPPVFNEVVSEDAPIYHGQAAVDIVAVHGLASKYPRCWSYERKDGSRFHWLRDKLPRDIPDARVLGFKYDSEWYGDPTHISLRECGAQLLRSLIRDRCHPGMPTMCPTRRKRPIIFIGHSFGGLVIKQALILAANTLSTNASRADYENRRDILSASTGVIFLGTPHRGSGFSVWADVKMFFGSLRRISTHKELTSIMKVGSAVVTDLQDQFDDLYFDLRLSGFKLVCYWEGKEVALPPHIVVDRVSACLDYAACREMNANHMEMNKFHDGPGRDENYDHLLADIRMMYEASSNTAKKRFEAWQYGSSAPDFDRERLLLWLGPSTKPQKTQYLDKLATQHSAPYTCQWIKTLPKFSAWINDPLCSNLLWINGKTGSGKSVLAAYTVHHLAANGAIGPYSVGDEVPKICSNIHGQRECLYQRNSATVLFFFCGVDRANETPEKMLGTLIHQLLLVHDTNQKLFSMAFRLREEQRDGADASSLGNLLLNMTSVIGHTYIIIDGLEENLRLMACVKTLSMLHESQLVKFLFLSQDTSEVSKALDDNFGPQEPIYITAHTKPEIDQFAAEKSAELVHRKQDLKFKEAFIIDKLQNGAQGMFLWVNSALEYLEQEVYDADDVQQRLQDLPKDIVEAHEKTLERLAKKANDYRDRRIRVALQVLTASATSVSPLDLMTAIHISERQDDAIVALLDRTKTRMTMDRAASEMRRLLGSLVEFPSKEMVRLAHPSLQSALTRPGPTGKHEGTTARYKFTLEEAHSEVLQLCMTACGKTTFVHANAFTPNRLPFVEYAWTYWAYHFHESECVLGDQAVDISKTFDKMLKSVSSAALAYLDALIVFLSQPLKAVPGHISDREYVLSLKRAQECLIRPTKDLCQLKKIFSLSSQLQDARTAVQLASTRRDQGSIQIHSWRRATSFESIRRLKKRMLGCETEVQRLKVDEFNEQLDWLESPSGSPKLVLDMARNLRLVALRFAVDPVFSSLIMTADGTSFSPLHPLLYLAQLFEEAGTYPYWKLLPPSSDLLDNFMCATDDPEYASAKFVLHCFEWRDHKTQTDAANAGHYVRVPSVLVMNPRPAGHHLTRVSTENREQVRRLHEMPSGNFFVANYVYAAFKPSQGLVREYVGNPLAHLHMRGSLMMHEINDAMPLMDPNQAMHLAVPTAVRESPMREYFRAIPQLLQVHFVKFMTILLQVFGRLSKQALAVHFARLEVAFAELLMALAFFARFRTEEGMLPRLRGWYIVPGLLLFLIRCRYLPFFGAYYMPHAWSEFPFAYKHPAAYLDLQNTSGFWLWMTTVLRVTLYNMIGMSVIGVGSVPELADNPIGHAASSYGVFHHLCTLERSLFAFLTVAATMVACSLIMMRDAKTLSEVWRFSIFWWFNAFFALFASAANQGAMQSGKSVGIIFMLSIFQLGLLLVFIRFAEPIVNIISFCILPLTVPAMYLWRMLLSHHIGLAKAAGAGVFLFLVSRAFWISHRFIWDPYNVEGSLATLVEAEAVARKNLGAGEVMRVGWYPLGEAMNHSNGKIDSRPQARSAISSDMEVLQQELGSKLVQAAKNLQTKTE